MNMKKHWLLVAVLASAVTAHAGLGRLVDMGRTLVSKMAHAAQGAPERAYEPAHYDIDELSWNGQPIHLTIDEISPQLGASAHVDQLEWRVDKPAYGAALQPGHLVGRGRSVDFKPVHAGLWTLSLSLEGQRIQQQVRLRLYRLQAQHPRIFLNSERLKRLRKKIAADSEDWKLLKKETRGDSGNMLSEALYSVLSGDPDSCQEAIRVAHKKMQDKHLGNSRGGDVAVVYDWCYPMMSPSQRQWFIDTLNRWADRYMSRLKAGEWPDRTGLGNYWPRFSYSFAVIGLATWGDNPRAMEWINYFRDGRWPIEKGFLDLIAEGGGWPEGIVYDGIANFSRMRAVDAWRIATGEDLFESSKWFKERFGTLLLQHRPGSIESYDTVFHPYASNGDYERNRDTMDSYWRIAALILVDRYPRKPLSQQLRAYLSAPPTARSNPFIQYAELIWFDPDGPAAPPTLTAHFDKSLGKVAMRSGWPDGARDLDKNVTLVNFQCGDFYSYHQHLDQNSFLLYRNAPLLLDSGIYSGNGTSTHDSNYYIRTIAHNSLLVYNPDEDFTHVRYNAYSNDGGQRAVYPATRAPLSVAQYLKDRKYYDVCDILHYSDQPAFTYVSGDATKAYNSVRYAQSQDTDLKQNVPKLKHFIRELVYLRPTEDNKQDYVVLYDRVAVTRPAFSGENTKLLFHLQNRPKIDGSGEQLSPGETLYRNATRAEAVNGDGKLLLFSVLPKAHNLRLVGGRGKKAYWVFGKNYNWHWKSDQSLETGIQSNFEKTPYGLWRIELEPADQQLAHNFLTVLLPSQVGNDIQAKIEAVEAGTFEGVRIGEGTPSRVLLFAKSAESDHQPVEQISYLGGEESQLYVFNLKPGAHYTRLAGSHPGKITLKASAEGEWVVDTQGVLVVPVDHFAARR